MYKNYFMQKAVVGNLSNIYEIIFLLVEKVFHSNKNNF